jgi:AraC-like DNA-binding protein
MLAFVHTLDAPELDAFHRHVNVHAAGLRVSFCEGRQVVSDYALLQRAHPFLHVMGRSSISMNLQGRGRFEEGGRRAWLDPGDLVLSDQRRGGTEAYAGDSVMLVVDWSPPLGKPLGGDFSLGRLDRRDRARLIELGRALLQPAGPAQAVARMLELLRAMGLPLESVTARDLEADETDCHDQRLHQEMGEHLSRLDRHPSIDELSERIAWNHRRIHRHIASSAARHALPWHTWRGALQYARLLRTIQLLGSPRATTERVARAVGFRSPSALCHALAEGGLPSPGVLAHLARRDALSRWVDFGPRVTAGGPQKVSGESNSLASHGG